MAKKEFNTTNIGDNIVLIQMKDNISRVPLGTKGVIKRIVEDPFDKGQYIVSVDWENGSTLNLLTSEDIWFKEVGNITESVFDKWDRLKTILKKSEIIKIKDFILALRDSGVINMFEAVPFIWSGGDYLENYIRFKGLDIENIEELKDMADESKNAIIRMVLSHLEKEGEEYDLDKINKTVKNFSRLAFQYYMETF
jgi:hypothetical protein